jgi:TatA/E family protein of Tat protein translocase
LGFLDIGWPELLLVLVVVLIVFGPGRVVEISRTLGKTVRAFKKATSSLTAQVTREIEEEHSSGQEEKKDDRTDKLAKS